MACSAGWNKERHIYGCKLLQSSREGIVTVKTQFKYTDYDLAIAFLDI